MAAAEARLLFKLTFSSSTYFTCLPVSSSADFFYLTDLRCKLERRLAKVIISATYSIIQLIHQQNSFTRQKNQQRRSLSTILFNCVMQCCPTFLTPRAAQDIIMTPRAAPVKSKVTSK